MGDVPFLNAELFVPSEKWNDREVQVENRAFDLLFGKLLNPYNFTVSETSPFDVELAFNQDLLGCSYEELIADQHGQGAYYTLPTEVHLMCRESLRAYLETCCPTVDKKLIVKLMCGGLTVADNLPEEDALCLCRALHDVTILDPALGSGTFPVTMLKHLFAALRKLGGLLQASGEFQKMLRRGVITDPADAYALKLHIIEHNIYGCDIDHAAVQIAKLRFWIELMVHCDAPTALPNFGCKLVVGDALVSAVGTNAKGNLVTLENLLGHPICDMSSLPQKQAHQFAALKSRYFTVCDAAQRRQLENEIAVTRRELLRYFGIVTDRLAPTGKHVLWQIDFAEIFMGTNPGFDIAIANPPYLRHELIDEAFDSSGLAITLATLRSVYANTLGVNVPGQSDLYVFFFLRALALVKRKHGHLCFICSNSWLDVDYGGCLQEHFAANTSIRAIVDNKFRRSFAQADINTAITLFTTDADTATPPPNLASFVSYRVPFDEGGPLPVSRSLTPSVVDTPSWRHVTISQQQLLDDVRKEASRNAKWGSRYLRAPSIYFEFLTRTDKDVVPLSAVAEVGTYLNTGGADGFFFLRLLERDGDSVRIETSDGSQSFSLPGYAVRPILRSPRDCDQILVTDKHVQWCVFVYDLEAQETPSEVRRLIRWGEEQGFHKRSGCRNRVSWYKLTSQAKTGSPILVGRNHDRSHIVYYNPQFIVSNRFYRIAPKPDYPVEGLAIFLNSSLGWLQKELLGRTNLGQGALDTQGTDLARILVPTHKLCAVLAEEVSTVFRRIITRKALPVDQELARDDRCDFDTRVLRVLGCADKVGEVHAAVSDLVNARVVRARSQ